MDRSKPAILRGACEALAVNLIERRGEESRIYAGDDASEIHILKRVADNPSWRKDQPPRW